MTHSLERKQAAAQLAQLSRIEQKTQQRKLNSEVIQWEKDGKQAHYGPTEVLDGEQVMSLELEEVTIISTIKTLPERMGKVTIDFMVNIPKELLSKSSSIVITPYLHKFGEAIPMEDLNMRGVLFDKLQQRDYWQYETYLSKYKPDSLKQEKIFNRFVKFPYPEDVRLDSLVEHKLHISYYYSQELPTDQSSKRMLVTLQGYVQGIDESVYLMPATDTLSYVISSMISFVDMATRYKVKIIDKYMTVNERSHIQFPVNSSTVIDTLGDNLNQLLKIKEVMNQVINQDEFYVDTITITASASPEGSYERNNHLSKQRAFSLKNYFKEQFDELDDESLQVNWIAEDWDELKKLIQKDKNIMQATEILQIIDSEMNLDKRETIIRNKYPKDYHYIRNHLYPQLRAVTFRYDLRRKDMVKDTIHTKEVDTLYAKGVEYLNERRYARALEILEEYQDRNTVIAHLSVGNDQKALEVLLSLPKEAVHEYLKAIVYSRLNRKEEGRICFLEACELDASMEFRANLDPEIAELLNE